MLRDYAALRIEVGTRAAWHGARLLCGLGRRTCGMRSTGGQVARAPQSLLDIAHGNDALAQAAERSVKGDL